MIRSLQNVGPVVGLLLLVTAGQNLLLTLAGPGTVFGQQLPLLQVGQWGPLGFGCLVLGTSSGRLSDRRLRLVFNLAVVSTACCVASHFILWRVLFFSP
ncbi:MAG: hypothetical protein O2782_22630 [bacterium]|nr:hypothetical protein [bacterium]